MPGSGTAAAGNVQSVPLALVIEKAARKAKRWDESDRIRQELLLADGQWVFFDAALQRMQAGGVAGSAARQVSEVFVASENLLSSMDRVTGLYAGLAG